MAVYNGQRGFLGEVRRSGLDDAASRREAALLQGVILRGLLHQGHCGSDVLAAVHTGLVKAGGHGVVCASVQGHVVEGHAGDVRVCRAIIRLGRSRYPGDRQRLLPNADRHAGGCGIVVVCIANHPIPHGICSGIGAVRGVLAVCAVLGQAVPHGAMVRHARSNQRLLLSGIGQIFLRRGSDEGGGSLVHLDGHSSGRSRVFLVARSRGERPFGFIVVICIWLDCAILPCECAGDCITRVGVFHLASDAAVVQRLTIGNLACADCAVRLRFDLVHRVEDELQLKVCVVGGGDIHLDGTDFAGHFSIFRIELCQCQHAFFKLYDRLVVIVPTLRNKGNISLTIAYRAIFAPGQSGQYTIEVIGVRLTCAVDYVQCADRVIHGHGGLIDLEGLIIKIRAVQCKVLLGRAVVKDIALILQLDGEGDSLFGFACIGGIIAGVEHLIICTLSQPKRSTSIIVVRALKCEFRICRQVCRSVVCLNDVSHRSRYFERSDRPFGRLTSGIIAVVCCLDSQRTGPYIVGAAAAGNGEILVLFQRLAFVCHDKRRHTGRRHRIKGRFIAIGECDLGIAEIRLGDGQRLYAALHRVAVLGGGEIDGVFSDCIEGVIFCILPTGIARLRQGDGRCFARLENGERHLRTLRIAAGAELDGRAALHLRRVAGQVLAIDL